MPFYFKGLLGSKTEHICQHLSIYCVYLVYLVLYLNAVLRTYLHGNCLFTLYLFFMFIGFEPICYAALGVHIHLARNRFIISRCVCKSDLGV